MWRYFVVPNLACEVNVDGSPTSDKSRDLECILQAADHLKLDDLNDDDESVILTYLSLVTVIRNTSPNEKHARHPQRFLRWDFVIRGC